MVVTLLCINFHWKSHNTNVKLKTIQGKTTWSFNVNVFLDLHKNIHHKINIKKTGLNARLAKYSKLQKSSGTFSLALESHLYSMNCNKPQPQRRMTIVLEIERYYKQKVTIIKDNNLCNKMFSSWIFFLWGQVYYIFLLLRNFTWWLS